MIQRIEQRLKELKGEFEAGQKVLADLETRQTNVKSTLLRISGAIQVLEEELKAEPQAAAQNNGTTSGDTAQADPSLVNGSLDRVTI